MLIAKMPDGSPEVYPACQGEGITIGKLCVFVRCAGCNLKCTFCDSSYAWYWEGGDNTEHKYFKPVKKDDVVMQMTPKQVAEAIIKAGGKHTRVVFTGGEPLLQQKEIAEVLSILAKDKGDWEVEIETNGTILIREELAEYLFLIENINCSPKLESSGNYLHLRQHPEVIQQYLGLSQKQQGASMQKVELCFKFVIGAETFNKDMKEVKAWEKENKVPRNLIYLMPEGIDREVIAKGTDKLLELALKEGYQLSTRLQVLLYGNKRAC